MKVLKFHGFAPNGGYLNGLLVFASFWFLVLLSSAPSEESTKGKSEQTIQAGWPARDSVPVKVTDDGGRPVQGAKVTPEELGDPEFVVRWSDKDYGSPPTVRTNAVGVALVPYPIEVSKGTKTTRIFFVVDHPEFCLRHAVCFVIANDLAQRGEPPVALSRGAQLEVSGYMTGTKGPAAGMIAQIDTTKAGLEMNRSCWKEAMPGVLQASRLPPGLLRLRLVVMPLNSLASFSEVVELDLKPCESRKLKVQLNPGIRLEGKLDPAVPRPVLNGWASLAIIAARTEAPPTQNLPDRWAWFACERIREDGSFLFPSLPKGEAGLVAGCEGFLSTDPRNAGQNPPLGQEHFVHRNAHYVPLKEKVVKFTVPAEKTGTAEFKVIDPAGRPVAGATVEFLPYWDWQNTYEVLGWNDYGTAVALRDEKLAHKSGASFPSYSATSDANGVARVNNLPGGQQLYSVTHPAFSPPAESDLPFSENPQCSLLIEPGKISKHTSRMTTK